MGRLFDICVDTHVEKYIYLNTKEKIKNHDSYKSSSIKEDRKKQKSKTVDSTLEKSSFNILLYTYYYEFEYQLTEWLFIH